MKNKDAHKALYGNGTEESKNRYESMKTDMHHCIKSGNIPKTEAGQICLIFYLPYDIHEI